jgi:hypothetical protein
MVGHMGLRQRLCGARGLLILPISNVKGSVGAMKAIFSGSRLRILVLLSLCGSLAVPAVPAMKSLAVIASAGNKLTDVSLADLAKLCKGTQKTWPDGRNFVLVVKDPESAEMRVAVQKLLGAGSADAKAAIGKLNESRQVIKIVENDEELLRTVGATPGAIGLVDVYAINSSVKVLRVDGKLPFDVGYVFKGN